MGHGVHCGSRIYPCVDHLLSAQGSPATSSRVLNLSSLGAPSGRYLVEETPIEVRVNAFMNLLQSSEPSVLDRALQLVHYPLHVFRNPVSTFLSIPGLSPALSFLIIPTFSSYSTSLNLLFFYLTWSTLVWSNPPLKIELIGTLAIRILFYIIPSLISLLLDSAVPNVAVSIKEHGDGALPLSEEQGGRKGRWWKVALVSIGNVLLGVIIQGSVEYLFTEILYIRSALKASTTIPLPWSIAWDVLRGLLLREVCTCLLCSETYSSLISNSLI